MTNFYSALADDYDGMTQFDTRLPKVQASLEAALAGHMPSRALDVACGTGICALALAELGLSVVGTDPNADMIDKAKINANALGVIDVRFDVAFMQDEITDLEPVDLITCLGNSIPHVSRDELPVVARRFHSSLRDGGRVIVQLKNFERILADGNRFVGAGRTGDKELIRFYDLSEDVVSFNVLRLNWEGDRATHEWIQTDLTPFTRADLERAFLGAGFSNVSFHASLEKGPFHLDASSDVVMVADV